MKQIEKTIQYLIGSGMVSTIIYFQGHRYLFFLSFNL
uniref:Uncharacterized protein n=1 Tax=Arundo donax TaxID=35708 RepID=A0A0A9F132_ARUDO